MGRRNRLGQVGALLASVLVLAACSSSPSSSPELAATSLPSAAPTSDVVVETPVTTPEATATPPPPPSVAGDWHAVIGDAAAGAQLTDVVWTGTKFIATGGALAGGGVFVSSADGQKWKSATAGGTTGAPYRITAGPAGIVAVGTLDNKTATWHSTDGIHWEYHLKVFPKSLAGSDQVQVTDVIPGSNGWLAVGRDDAECMVSCGPEPLRALIWTSDDGLDWTQLGAQASLKHGGINAVVQVEGVGYVAAGDSAGHAAFWRSVDGLTWTRVDDDPSFASKSSGDTAAIVGVAAVGAVIVAVGMDTGGGGESPPTVRAWRSTDGATWTEATVEDGADGQVFAVAATNTGFIATGPSGENSCLGGVWTSTDGAAWTCAASDHGFAGFGPYAAAGSSEVEVAVGLTNAGCEGDDACPDGLPGAIWYRPIR